MKTTKAQGDAMRKRIYNIIVDYMLSHGYPPTIREIAERADLLSTSSVYHQLSIMAARGMIDYAEGSPRTITVPGIRYIDERGQG